MLGLRKIRADPSIRCGNDICSVRGVTNAAATHALVSVRVLLGPIGYAVSIGLDPTQLLVTAGIDPTRIADVDGFVPLRVPGEFLAQLHDLTATRFVGLQASECVDAAAFDVFRYTGASSQTVGDALVQFIRWFPILSTGVHMTSDQSADGVHLRCEGPRNALGKHSVEYILACTVRGFQEIACEPFAPVRVEFRHSADGDTSAAAQFFGCPVDFDASHDSIVFPAGLMSRPARQPDRTLNRLMQRHLEELAKKTPAGETFMAAVERAIVAEIGNGEVTAGAIARRLHVSTRTLQRRLGETNTTFRGLLDAVREQLARKYLRTNGVTTAEIAFLLGFSDVPTFHRAFRRWTGQTPYAYATGTSIADAA